MSDFLYRLLRPRHWLRNYPTSLAWDAFVLRAIAAGDVRRVDKYHAMIGGKGVWVQNYPFAFGRPVFADVMPRASTVDALLDALMAQALADAPVEVPA